MPFCYQPQPGQNGRERKILGYHRSFPLADVEDIQFYADYTAVANTKIKLHFIFTGPEFWTYTDDEWYDAKANSYDFFGLITNTDWKKGTYTLVIIAEPQTLSSGAECVAMCVFKLE